MGRGKKKKWIGKNQSQNPDHTSGYICTRLQRSISSYQVPLHPLCQGTPSCRHTSCPPGHQEGKWPFPAAMVVGGRKRMPPISALKHLGLTQGNPFGDTMGSATSPTSPHILASVGRMYRSVPQSHFYSTAWTHQSIMDMSPHSHGISQPGSVMLQQISCSTLLFSAVYFLLEADLGLLWVWSSSRNLGIPRCILSFPPCRQPQPQHRAPGISAP